MGMYAKYLAELRDYEKVEAERKRVLADISRLRGGRDTLVFAADLSKAKAPIGIDYTDLLAVQDQLENLDGGAIDVILETPGGSGEVVEDLVLLIRGKYEKAGIIVPGCAKSAGTILAMAGDEILMGSGSALGPIDGQVQHGDGKRYSADAFLEGLEKIKRDADKTKKLSIAHIPILQSISPGEIQKCENIQAFSKHLVTDWLAKYKFKYWNRHSNGQNVTDEEKCKRANEIAAELCSQSRWFIHARSIKIDDLKSIGIKITDYREEPELGEAIAKYYVLLRLSFEMTTLYKIFETRYSQIYRFVSQIQPRLPGPKKIMIDSTCQSCKHTTKLQISLEKGAKLEKDAIPYPIPTDSFKRPKCGDEINLSTVRRKIEAQLGQEVR